MNFNRKINRQQTQSVKYDLIETLNKPEDTIPMWVADMDFSAPPQVIEALVKRAEHGVFGYSEIDERYCQAVIDWFQTRFNWLIERDTLVTTPGIVYAINTAIRALTKKGDAILIQEPVYNPFKCAIENNNRQTVVNPLVFRENRYHIDFDDFENKIKSENVVAFILCTPHNPVGRVWQEEELKRIKEICQRYDVLILSDEIHCDFVYPPNAHRIFETVNPDYVHRIITMTSPSKTFNLAGLQGSNIIIPDEALRCAFKKEMEKQGSAHLNAMSITATIAAYEEGAPWLEDLLEYLQENIALTQRFLEKELPEIRLIPPEGTYLLWLDFKGLGLSNQEIAERLEQRCRLWLNAGSQYGAGGEGHWRLNVATSRANLEEALRRLKKIK